VQVLEHTAPVLAPLGVTHCPEVLQVLPLAQVPQLPPQPSGPHCLPVQLGVQLLSHLPVL
jgi:hypothetical protein